MTSHIFSFRPLKSSATVLVFTAILLLSGSSEVPAQKKKPATKPAAAKTNSAPKATTTPATAGKCSGSKLTVDETNQALAVHNFERVAYKVVPLRWDCKLAAMAQEWADRGVFEHRETPYGENIFVSARTDLTMNAMIDVWLAEKAFWNNKAGSCAAGKVCGHFTQVVWKSTAKVGCGVNRNASGNWKAMFVCNYDPAGNTNGPAY